MRHLRSHYLPENFPEGQIKSDRPCHNQVSDRPNEEVKIFTSSSNKKSDRPCHYQARDRTRPDEEVKIFTSSSNKKTHIHKLHENTAL
jgi:hypothetical protein